MNNQKNSVTKIVTRDEVIRFLAKDLGENIQPMRTRYRLWEDKIREILSEAEDGKDVSIRLFDGIKLESKFVPVRERLDTLTGQRKMYDSKVKAKASLSKRYLEKVNRKKKSLNT